MHKKANKFLQAVMAFPVLAMSFTGTPFPGATVESPLAAAISPDQTRTLISDTVVNQHQAIVDEAGAKIDAYYAKYNLNMEGMGSKLAEAAVDNNLPPTLLAAMSVIESTGMDDNTCAHRTNNPFGYGSCKIKFASVDQAITTVAETLSGKRPATAHAYAGKTLEQKLRTYNGADADANYVYKVKFVMNQMNDMPIDTTQTASLPNAKA